MGLSKYREKRNFESTAEPIGKTEDSKSDLSFVVQKHAATQLHYDFRLELDGVLKSWAIPKGPSMNPNDKRLAVMVEDHPYDYKDFEGNILEGNYGAGNVIVWDNGSYSAINSTSGEDAVTTLQAGLLKGHLAIHLNGKKLKGEFDLFRLKGKDENAWLLVKKKDNDASDKDILLENKSVLTNRTLEELAKVSPRLTASEKRATLKKEPVKSTQPDFREPMLAERVEKPFDKKDWIFEVKFDGYRTIAVLNPEDVHLFSRNRISFTTKFQSITDELQKIKHAAVLDGEVVIEDSNGRSDFQLLQDYQKNGKGTLKYYVFDLLNLDGNDTTGLSLLERKELLKILLSKYTLENVIFSEHKDEKGISFFEVANEKNWEGIMAKDGKSPYRVGKRSNEWLKIKRTLQDEAIIVGITKPKGSRAYFGALLLARYEGNDLKYIGNCGTGFSEAALKELYAQFKEGFTDSSPITEKIKTVDKVQWLVPKFIAQVKYTEVTGDGYLRHPVFLGLRIDKTVDDMRNDALKPVDDKVNEQLQEDRGLTDTLKNNGTEGTKKNYDLMVGSITLHLTNQDKMYFPGDNVTKGDVLNYYREVADIMIPYLKDRPQSMNRFPNGIDSAGFYQKDIDVEKTPAWLKTQKIFSESNGKDIDYLICNDTATLLYMVNLGCIEMNPWNSTVQHLDNPDWLVIDLDPEKEEFPEVVRTALMVKEVLDELETEGFCKTSGATGLHIYVPLAGRYAYESVKLFAQFIAARVNERLPETTTITRAVRKREHKIYIDYLQNLRGQTLAAPYSVRPVHGTTISTPLDWSEVTDKLSPSQFTIKNILTRLNKKGDLWSPVLGRGANIENVLKKLSGNKI